MTKELYGKCRNPLKQAFCALDAETQAALKEAAAGGNAEYLHAHSGLWDGIVQGDLGGGRVYRISDKAAPPPEPRWVDAPVNKSAGAVPYWHVIAPNGDPRMLSDIHAYCDFEGVTYDTGFVKLNPYNPAVGTPVSVRFRK